MQTRLIQPSFSSGELSPSLRVRVDLARYASGLKTSKNMIIHPQGGASNRPGDKFITGSKFNDKKSRVVPFEFSVEQAYVIEFGHLYCRFYMDGGAINVSSAPTWSSSPDGYHEGDYVTYNGIIYYCIQTHITKQPDLYPDYWTPQTIYEIVTEYQESDLPKLKFTQSADVLYIVHPNHVPRTLTRLAHDSWDLFTLPFVNGPFMPSNFDEEKTLTSNKTSPSDPLAGVLESDFDIFTSGHIGALFKIRHYVQAESLAMTISGNGNSASLRVGKTWRFITHGVWSGKVKVERSLDGGTTWTTLGGPWSSNDDFNVNTYGTEDDICLLRVASYGWISGSISADLIAEPWTANGIVKVTAVTDSMTASITVLKELGHTTVTSDWSEGSWSIERGFPSVVVFYQDRLTLAATKTEPQTVWPSKTGSYYDFGRSSPLVDSDSISLCLPSRKMNGIKSLVPLSNILALTSATEWSIGPGSKDAITPTSIKAECEGYRGCSDMEPVVVGKRAIFAESMGSLVRDIAYDFSKGGFDGDDLSILSTHLFERRKIVEAAYQQSPDSIIWFVCNDGKLISLTYHKEQEILAWSLHETDGEYESIASIPGENYHEIWFVVKRGNKRFIEKMVQRMESTEVRDQFFVDCGLTYDQPMVISNITKSGMKLVVTCSAHGLSNGDTVDISDVVGLMETTLTIDEIVSLVSLVNWQRYEISNITTDTFEIDEDGTTSTDYISGGNVRLVVDTITGLNHLEGKTVAILGDGSVQNKKVVTSGQIVLDSPVSIAHVGLPYTSELCTLSVDPAMQNGTSQGRLKIISQVMIKFLNSRGGLVGVDEDHLYELPQRTNEPLGQPINLFSDDQEISLDGNYTTNGQIMFRQQDPLPVTILAIIPDVTY